MCHLIRHWFTLIKYGLLMWSVFLHIIDLQICSWLWNFKAHGYVGEWVYLFIDKTLRVRSHCLLMKEKKITWGRYISIPMFLVPLHPSKHWQCYYEEAKNVILFSVPSYVNVILILLLLMISRIFVVMECYDCSKVLVSCTYIMNFL